MNDTSSNEEWRSWSGAEAGRYEAALEAISGAMGAYSAVIAREEAKENPDGQVIEKARQGRRACIRRREDLDPADVDQVAQVRSEFTELAQTVRESFQ
ncbi:hypothetical protein HNR06_002612 [Nocardiopsis arvandica]|uniref:Uncharacterized protein n=1 Tax=Nocardiopsis sinuspersici TaxID=501010 RepID=A0A7Y9XEC5_9ACTN|nr:hypothetical protein [Nocardiopsis sinuspersici]NYH53023.1 hypothetical protein [Nocardiopsis sinuspersici]